MPWKDFPKWIWHVLVALNSILDLPANACCENVNWFIRRLGLDVQEAEFKSPAPSSAV